MRRRHGHSRGLTVRHAALALAASAGCGDGTRGGAAAPAEPPAVRVPAAVLGAWRSGRITPATFWDDQSRNWPESGVALMYTFERDGRYVSRLYAIGRAFGCVHQVWHEVHGTVEFGPGGAPGTFVSRPAEGRRRSTDTCQARNNFDRAMTPPELADDTRTYYWDVHTGPGGGVTLSIGRTPEAPVYFDRAQ